LTPLSPDGASHIVFLSPSSFFLFQKKQISKRASAASGVSAPYGASCQNYQPLANPQLIRGVYVTSDLSGEVFMSLDSEKGQETLFLANPGGGAHLDIYDAQRNLASIGVLNNQPTLVLKRAGNTIFEQPQTK
jgi:hypothetical protein